MDSEKPSLEEVLAYVKPIIWKFIGKFASDEPREHKEEIEQEAYIKIIKAYEKLDPNAGWKSFVYNHARGAVLDYLKAGDGFEETSWSILKEEEEDAVHRNKMRNRICVVNEDGDELDIDHVLGINGKFSEIRIDIPKINWDVLERMAAQDMELHAFLRTIRGQTLELIASVLGKSRASVGKMVDNFIERFDDPRWASDFGKKPWLDQIIWALGLANEFDIEDCDQTEIYQVPLGHFNDPVDLNSEKPKFLYDNERQQSFGFLN